MIMYASFTFPVQRAPAMSLAETVSLGNCPTLADSLSPELLLLQLIVSDLHFPLSLLLFILHLRPDGLVAGCVYAELQYTDFGVIAPLVFPVALGDYRW